MATEPQGFTAQYASLGEAELLALAHDYDALTEPAQTALRAEFSKRGMEPPLVEETGDQFESRKLVTLRQYRDLSEAIIARGMLESAGIQVFLQDENLIRLDWQVSNAIGGIRLQVDEADTTAALELLTQPVPKSITLDDGVEFEQPMCPRCGSVEVTFDGPGRAAQVASVFTIGLPLPPGRESWSCASCGARWEDTDD